MRPTWCLMFACAITACASDDNALETDDLEATDDGKADGSGELRVRASDTTLWVDRALERRGELFVLHGRASRNLTDGNAFIFDDVFGEFAQQSARTFEVVWRDSELRGVVDGVNLFTSLGFVHSSSRPDRLTSRVVVRPRLGPTSGSSSLALTAELTPVIVAGRTVYRIKGRSTKPITELATTSGSLQMLDATHFELDLDFAQLVTQTAPGTQLAVTATHATNTTTIRASLGLSVKRLGLTSGDIEVVFPSPTCTAERLACLEDLPDGTLDLASCGPALEVSRCAGQVGAFIDGPAIDATLVTLDARLVDPAGFASDATGLVGADRAVAFTAGVRQQIAAGLDGDRGLWLASTTARQTLLDRDVEGPLDAAYARPLSLVTPHTPVAGDLAATRQVCADALLAKLASTDFVATEFHRSLDELTKQFRARHVQNIREFRETIIPETFTSMPNTDFYIGQWLDPHVEVSVDRTTGMVTNVLVEID